MVEAEKKIRDEKEAKSRAALADVDEEQEGVTSEDYKESEEKPSNGEAQVGYLSTQVYCFGEYAEYGFDQQRLIWYVFRL